MDLLQKSGKEPGLAWVHKALPACILAADDDCISVDKENQEKGMQWLDGNRWRFSMMMIDEKADW